MARGFLFLWVFALPLALLHEDYDFIAVLFFAFLSTYGFVGIEKVSIEMEDPFGNDQNDISEEWLAEVKRHILCYF